jgi:hypothetical protein
LVFLIALAIVVWFLLPSRHRLPARHRAEKSPVVLAQPAGAVSSDFETSAEGWRAASVPANGPYNAPGSETEPTYRGGGGNPGGYLHVEELGVGTTYWVAPPQFLGDRSGAYGGTLSFGMCSQWERSAHHARPDVVLAGAGLVLVYDIPENPTREWRTFRVPLVETAGWRKNAGDGPTATRGEFLRVLGSLNLLRIRAEYVDGIDSANLDNVHLTPHGAR